MRARKQPWLMARACCPLLQNGDGHLEQEIATRVRTGETQAALQQAGAGLRDGAFIKG